LRVAVVRFPGSNCDLDTVHVLRDVVGVETDLVWHRYFDGSEYDGVVLPGGFSYGDYLRAGVIAAHSPAVKEVAEMGSEGKPVLGICNGFQILIEAGLLPGALLANDCLMFVCKWITVRVETDRTAFTNLSKEGRVLHMPVAHFQGRYVNDQSQVKEMFRDDQIVFRYVDDRGEPTPESNPNGSVSNIAGVCNLEGNVVGLMPHPERSSEGVLSPTRCSDGAVVFRSLMECLRVRGKIRAGCERS
jgi:phosphoribosylformylglycinamidine synthase